MRTNMKALLAIILLTVVLAPSLSPTRAAAPNETFSVYDDPSCGEWIQERDSDGQVSIRNGVWLLGYLSGYSAAMKYDLFSQADRPSIFLWMDTFCHAHPLTTVVNGTVGLISELHAKEAKRAR